VGLRAIIPRVTRTWTYPRVREGRRVRPLAALAHVPVTLELRRQRFDAALVMNGDESPRAIRRALWTGRAASSRTRRCGALRIAASRTRCRLPARPRGRPHDGVARAARRSWPPARARDPEYTLPASRARSRASGSRRGVSRPIATS
jgi:hypothetical protein